MASGSPRGERDGGPLTPPFSILHAPARAGDRRLEGWRANVGDAVSSDVDAGGAGTSLLVISWNVWIGRGRLLELIELLREGKFARLGADPGLPVVVLLQEAFRADSSVPARSSGHGPREVMVRAHPREDVCDVAARVGMSLRYAPSMRNGAERSDRGNAILSSLPIVDAHAVELPFEYQRRVAVAATIAVGATSLRMVSTHLDPRGPVGHRWLGAAGRAVQIGHLLAAVGDDTAVIGADLNLGRGRAEPTWRLLQAAGFHFGVPEGVPSWRHTYHALPRLVLDYILVRNRTGAIAKVTIHRLDEDPADRGPTVFGSDHHPLLARIDLR